MFYYSAYSLIIGSELPLPEWPEANGEPDILIRVGTVPKVPCNATLNSELAIHNSAGAFQITNGREIVVDPLPGADPNAVRLLLLGRMMAYLLRQRGWLPLHASGVTFRQRSVLFLGHSGAGKSTTAAAFHRAGHQIVTDDVAPVRISDNKCIALPVRPRLRLDTHSRFLMAAHESQGVLEFDGKYRYELPRAPLPEAIEVQRIYVLEDGETIESRPIPPVHSVRFLSAHCFFRRRRMDQATLAAHLRHCAEVARMASIRLLTRPRLLRALPDLVKFVENDLTNG